MERTTGTPQPQLEPLALYLLRAFNNGLHLLDPVSRLQFLFYIGNDALGPSLVSLSPAMRLVTNHQWPQLGSLDISRCQQQPCWVDMRYKAIE